jgi:dolichol-phosphate mannosyltransferase
VEKKIVIIPTYNEKENIEEMMEIVLSMESGFHILVVDDNSPDGTGNLVKAAMSKNPDRLFILEREKKEGLGRAYLAGFKWCLEREYDFICEMDADFSHNPYDLNRLVDACKEGADVAIGSRYVNGVNVVNWPMGRVMMSYYASAYVRMITRMKIRDTTAGFVCYKKEVLEALPLDLIKFKGYAFQIEMKFKSWKRKFKIVEVPIIFTDRTKGQSKMSKGIFKEAFFGVLELKIASWFGKY